MMSKPGRRSNYRKLLCEETGRDETQLRIDANDREGWRKVVRNMWYVLKYCIII